MLLSETVLGRWITTPCPQKKWFLFLGDRLAYLSSVSANSKLRISAMTLSISSFSFCTHHEKSWRNGFCQAKRVTFYLDVLQKSFLVHLDVLQLQLLGRCEVWQNCNTTRHVSCSFLWRHEVIRGSGRLHDDPYRCSGSIFRRRRRRRKRRGKSHHRASFTK